MFLVKLLRFFSGYIFFKGEGGFSERFINLCSVYDIPLWDVTYEKDFFTACTTIGGYFKIKSASKNSGVKIRKIKTIGLPFIVNRLKPRIGLLIGAVFFIAVFSLLSGKIWRIEVSGNTTVPTDVIISIAENAGLKTGVSAKGLNTRQISLDICKINDTLSWAAVKISGSCAYIDITERSAPIEIQSKEGHYNLVASKDAQLIALQPYSGTVLAKTYNPVLKGDILISSIVQNRDESVSFVHADGYAVGRTETSFAKANSTKLNNLNISLIKRTYKIEFFGIKIPLGSPPQKYSQCFNFKKNASFNKKALPISITENEYYVFSQKSKKISATQADSISQAELMNELYIFSQGKEIIESKINTDKQTHTSAAELICYENIGIKAPVEIEETS